MSVYFQLLLTTKDNARSRGVRIQLPFFIHDSSFGGCRAPANVLARQ
jgi:hypothetical protein